MPAQQRTLSEQLGLVQAFRSGRLNFRASKVPSQQEFDALTMIATAERRAERLNQRLWRCGEVWTLVKDNILQDFDVEDRRGNIRRAVSFWPSERYVIYVKDILQSDADIRKIEIFELIDRILMIECPKRKILVARFWLPGKPTVIESPRAFARETAEGIAWCAGIEMPSDELHITNEEYRLVLKEAYRRPMKCGPKGKLP